MALDPTTTESRLLSCAKCHEAVASSGFSGRMLVRCGYCNFEEERDLTAPAANATYREPGRALAKREKLEIDLEGKPPGLSVATTDAAALRTALAKRPMEEVDRAAVEWERAWIAIWLATRSAMDGDPLPARVALESALEVTTTPAYRALLCAHLAQHAASQQAVELANKWLALAPDVAVVEVESELRAARAMVALAEDDLDTAYVLTGGQIAGTGYRGHALFLAIALQLETLQRRGDFDGAAAVLRELQRKGQQSLVLLPMIAFRLGRSTLVRVDKQARTRDAVTSGALVALASTVLAASSIGIAPFALIILGTSALSALTSWATWTLAKPSASRQYLWRLSRSLIPALYFAISVARLAAGR